MVRFIPYTHTVSIGIRASIDFLTLCHGDVQVFSKFRWDDDDVFDELLEMNCQISIKYDYQLSEVKDSMFSKNEDVFASNPSQNASYNDFLKIWVRKNFECNFKHMIWLMSSIVLIVLMKIHWIQWWIFSNLGRMMQCDMW